MRMSPTEMLALGEVARHHKRSKADTVRVLIAEEHARLVATRGETTSDVPTTKRGE